MLSKGEQGMPGVGNPGQKGEKASSDVFVDFVSFNIIIIIQTNFADSLPFPRVSAACASHRRLAVDPLTSKCQREQKAVKVNQALRGHQDLQVLGLKANRCVCVIRKNIHQTSMRHLFGIQNQLCFR